MIGFKIHRNIKQLYYVVNGFKLLVPNFIYRRLLTKRLNSLKNFDFEYIQSRVIYYIKLNIKNELPEETKPLKNLRLQKKQTTYFFDSYAITRHFRPEFKVIFKFGDVIDVPNVPTVVKSRPITDDNENSVLLKLNKVRHFTYTKDTRKFVHKKNMLIGRGGISDHKKKRISFYNRYFNHPMCDLGQTNKNSKYHYWYKKKISIEEHLKYKFILCLEGIDVSSNLKWVMSSNSVAVMPKPTMETWFMEGRLIPNYHYIEIKKDYSDLEERLNYYIENPKECMEIIRNANRYVDQFRDNKRERLISLLVLKKYFEMTQQTQHAHLNQTNPVIKILP